MSGMDEKGGKGVEAKEGKTKNVPYFRLPEEDRLDLKLEDEQKEAKDIVAKKALEKLDKKYKK